MAVSTGHPKQYPGPVKREEVWSLAVVTYKDGTQEGLNITASPSITQHLISQLRDNGAFTLFNGKEAIMINGNEFKSIKVTSLEPGSGT